jgi:RNA polymerase sigma-70 factor (ECF subfamily)
LDTAELEELTRLYGKAVYGFCRRLTRDMADTDDLYQETFLKAIGLCSKIRKDRNPKGFLISIALGIWKNNLRKNLRHDRIAPAQEQCDGVSAAELLSDGSTPEDIVISRERRALIQAAADGLDEKLKIPLYMYYTAEMSVEEIAKVLKIPKGTVKSRLYKARKELEKVLEDLWYE